MWTQLGGSGGLGVGQTWQSPSRALNTNYTNATGKPIMVMVECYGGWNSVVSQIIVDGITAAYSHAVYGPGVTAVVPHNSVYRAYCNYGLQFWSELR